MATYHPPPNNTMLRQPPSLGLKRRTRLLQFQITLLANATSYDPQSAADIMRRTLDSCDWRLHWRVSLPLGYHLAAQGRSSAKSDSLPLAVNQSGSPVGDLSKVEMINSDRKLRLPYRQHVVKRCLTAGRRPASLPRAVPNVCNALGMHAPSESGRAMFSALLRRRNRSDQELVVDTTPSIIQQQVHCMPPKDAGCP
jgi:hypothetical protein